MILVTSAKQPNDSGVIYVLIFSALINIIGIKTLAY